MVIGHAALLADATVTKTLIGLSAKCGAAFRIILHLSRCTPYKYMMN